MILAYIYLPEQHTQILIRRYYHLTPSPGHLVCPELVLFSLMFIFRTGIQSGTFHCIIAYR